MEKAVLDIKQLCSGSVHCTKPEIRYYDTASSPDMALKLFKESYAKGVRLFVGLVTSAEAAAVAEYASLHAADAILISPTSTATRLCKYKKQLYRLTMDDRGYAEALFDLCLQIKENTNVKKLSVQVIYRNDLHGQGLYNDTVTKFSENSDEGLKILSPIAYSARSLSSVNFKNIIDQLSSSLANEGKSVIVLVGLAEVEKILEEAAKQNELHSHSWLLPDGVTLSNIKIPDTMGVVGLSFEGEEPESKLIEKEHRGVFDTLVNKELPPMKQSLLAYDSISLIRELYTKSHSFSRYVKSTMASEGLTGTLDFTSCHERVSGSYVFAACPRKRDVDNPLGKVVMGSKWLVISHFNVKVNSEDNNSNRFLMALQEDLSAEAMMEVNLQSTSKRETTSTASPAVILKRSEFLETFLDVDDKDCVNNAYVTVLAKDESSQRATNVTYTVKTLPEVVSISARYGYTVEAQCQTATEKITITQYCPPSKAAGTDLVCKEQTSTAFLKIDNSIIQSYGASNNGKAKASWWRRPRRCTVGRICNVVRVACGIGNRFFRRFLAFGCRVANTGCKIVRRC